MQELKANWIAHESVVYALAVSSNGNYVASASGDHTARVSDMCGNEVGSYVANGDLADVKFSPDQNHLILAHVNSKIIIIDWRLGSVVESLWGHYGSCYGIDFLPVRRLILSASLDNTVKVWCSKRTVKGTRPITNFGYSLEKTFTGHKVRARLMLPVPC